MPRTFQPGDLFDAGSDPAGASLVGVRVRLRCGDRYLCDVLNDPDDAERITGQRTHTAAELEEFDLIGGPTLRADEAR